MVTKNFLVEERHCACKTFSLGQRIGIDVLFPLTESNCAHKGDLLKHFSSRTKEILVIYFNIKNKGRFINTF